MNMRVSSVGPATSDYIAVAASAPVLQRACACGGSAGIEGKCAGCAQKERFGAESPVALGAPGDRFEVEADRVADQVMNTSAPDLQRMEGGGQNFLQRAPVAIQRMETEGDEEEMLQRKAAGSSAPGPAAISSAANAVATGGQPLPSTERAFFEPRFGRDLSHVRVHSGTPAGRATTAINAQAYTLRNNIAFAPGAYAPGTTAGRRLMAHEITHTLQQGAAPELTGVGGDAVVQRFTKKEHTLIGEKAFEKAYSGIQSIRTGPQMPAIAGLIAKDPRTFSFQSATRGTLSYGQLVAIADEIASFELLEEKENSGVPDIPLLAPIWNWIGNKTHYYDLASRNRAHFHPHNYLSWQPWHWQALQLMHMASQQSTKATGLKREVRELLQRINQREQEARRAINEQDALPRAQSNGSRAVELDRLIKRQLFEMERLLSQAKQKQTTYEELRAQASDMAMRSMAMNGYGDHFLTDAFSAGHIVTPRGELLDEYSTYFLGLLPLGGVLHCANIPSLAWHDLDNMFGVTVDNANGDNWRTFGDDYSSKDALPGGRTLSPTLRHVIDATATSISQMWQATDGRMPSSLLPVLNQLPRPKLANYPTWSPTDWNLQVRHAAGEQVGASNDVFPMAPRSERPTVKVPNPKGEQIGSGLLSARATCWDLLPEFDYDKFVVPMLARIRRDYAERYFTGRKSQIVGPDQAPTAQASVTGNVVLGSLIGGAAGIGLGLLAGGLIGGGLALALGGILGAAIGFLGGGFIGGFFGDRRDRKRSSDAGGAA